MKLPRPGKHVRSAVDGGTFFLLRGLARQTRLRFSRAKSAAARRRGPDRSLEFPAAMAAWKLAPGLACGNTCVLKPAETTSITALHLAEILQEVELPDGVVNIVTGAGETGNAVVNHPDIDKIAFTGSTEVGKRIATALAGTKKKLTLELGGKAANIIFDDASINQAVEGIVAGIYFNQGHVCWCWFAIVCAGKRFPDRHLQVARSHLYSPPRQSARQKHRHRRD
jgi:aldehyde dehydrogenase (NAD+)